MAMWLSELLNCSMFFRKNQDKTLFSSLVEYGLFVKYQIKSWLPLFLALDSLLVAM